MRSAGLTLRRFKIVLAHLTSQEPFGMSSQKKNCFATTEYWQGTLRCSESEEYFTGI